MTRTLRSPLWLKLLLGTLLVQITMLGVLGFQTMHDLQDRQRTQMDNRLLELRPLLSAALGNGLFQHDLAGIQELLDSLRNERGIRYLVLFDEQGKQLAASGIAAGTPLPALDADFDPAADRLAYNTSVPISLAGELYGTLHFGVATESYQLSQTRTLHQTLLLGAMMLAGSFILLLIISYWLTRHLRTLAR
jgi:uncharacterized membrane protein affecting hemolysin expression